MNKVSILSILIFITTSTSIVVAQEHKTFVERLSFEAGAGYLVPLSEIEGLSSSDFSGFRNFHVAANYELTDLWGLRFSYANNSFQDKNDSSMGLTLHKFMLEGTLNVIEWIEMQRNPFEVIIHGGAGMSLGKSKQSSGSDKMGTLQIGVMPLYRITDKVSIHLNAEYVANLKQNYGFDGKQFYSDGSHGTGEYFVMNFGLGLTFGF